MTPHEQIKESILSLQTALLAAHPSMPSLLQQIHSRLKNDPSIVTLLKEDEIAILVSGLEAQTQTHIVTNMAKPSAKTALKKVKSDDLGFD